MFPHTRVLHFPDIFGRPHLQWGAQKAVPNAVVAGCSNPRPVLKTSAARLRIVAFSWSLVNYSWYFRCHFRCFDWLNPEQEHSPQNASWWHDGGCGGDDDGGCAGSVEEANLRGRREKQQLAWRHKSREIRLWFLRPHPNSEIKWWSIIKPATCHV
jgi:hypothetical protein